MTHCYVYYRIAAGHEAAARRAVTAMQSELAATAGVTGQLFTKVAEPDLWMEVYPPGAAADALVRLLDALALRHGLLDCIADGQHRHTELFVALPAS